jgi:hypothetical protein
MDITLIPYVTKVTDHNKMTVVSNGAEVGYVQRNEVQSNEYRWHACLKIDQPVSGNCAGIAQGHGPTPEEACDNACRTAIREAHVYIAAVRDRALQMGVTL